MSDGAQWYVVHTYSGYENTVKATIEKYVENRGMQSLIHEISIPLETVTEITDNGPKEEERKVFPGYVLVKMGRNDETWHVVRNIRGVTGFLGEGNKAIPLSEADVAALGVEKREVVVSYQEGDTVRITDGALESFLGTVEEIDLDRSKVRVGCLCLDARPPWSWSRTRKNPSTSDFPGSPLLSNEDRRGSRNCPAETWEGRQKRPAKLGTERPTQPHFFNGGALSRHRK